MRQRQALRDLRGQVHRGVAGVIFGRPSGQVRNQGGEDQHRQQVQLWQPEAFHQPPQHDGQHHRRGADDQRAVVERITMEQREVGTFQHRLPAVALVLHPQRIAELTQRDQNGRGQQKAEDHGFGDVSGQVTELEHRNQNLERANQDAEQEQRLEQDGAILRVEERQRAEHQQRYRTRRAVDQMRRRAENRSDEGHHDRRVHTEFRVDAGHQRVGDALWQRHRGDREPGDQVTAGFVSVVVQALLGNLSEMLMASSSFAEGVPTRLGPEPTRPRRRCRYCRRISPARRTSFWRSR